MRRMDRHQWAPRLRAWAGLAALMLAPLLALRLMPGAHLARADFVFNNGGELASLDPHAGSGVPEGRVARALFEGLVRRDTRNLRSIPAAAERWQRSQDGLFYTFTLREDLRWSNGDPLTAEDFEWSFRRLLTPSTAAPFAGLLDAVVGAADFSAGRTEDWSTVGIRATDPLSLEIRLHTAQPLPEVLAHWAFVPVHRASLASAREEHPDTWQMEWLRPERLVVNGPFKVRERRVNDRLRLERNPEYWDTEAVAFDTIDVLAVEHLGTALNLYLTGAIDWLDGTLPTDQVPQLEAREDFHQVPFTGVYFYRFNVTRPPFDDVNVRRAFTWAIDRKTIVEELLGAGQRPATTFVPYGLLRGYRSPPLSPIPKSECIELFERAGYAGDNRKPFPRIAIHFNNSQLHRDLAEFVAAEWSSTFRVPVRLAPQEQRMYLDAQRNLDFDVSRSSWIADYVDVSNFLDLWVTDGVNNRTGWSNGMYDRLIEQAKLAPNSNERYALYAKAEAILMAELPIAPVYYYVTQNLVNPRLGGFGSNALNDQFPQDWYWMDEDELRSSRSRLSPSKSPVPNPPGPRRGKYSIRAQAEREAARAAPPDPGAGQ